MKRIAGILAAALLVTATPVVAAEYIVKMKDIRSESALRGVQILDRHEAGGLMKIESGFAESKEAEAKKLAELMADPNVEYVVENFRLHTLNAPLDAEALKEQWAITKVNAEAAWTRAGNRGSRNVLIAVIDTGTDYNHESLAANSVAGYDFKDNDSDPMDQTGAQNPGHGTHCAGIMGGTGTANDGIIGLSPEVSIMPLRFLGADGSGDLMAGIKAIDYAIEKGAEVISASWGASVSASQAQPLIDAVKRANDAGVIFVAAAANDGKNNDVTSVYPANANFPNTITVAASGPQDEKPSWSNYGKSKVHIAAPGLNIMSTLPGNKYGNLSGTSMATPLVSGLVAFLKAQDASLTGAQILAILQTTGAQVQIETACNCRVDADAATAAILNKAMTIVPAAATIGLNETTKFEVLNGSSPFQFAVADTSLATIAADGTLTSKAAGTTKVNVTDARGLTVQSLDILIKEGGSTPPPAGDCPLGDPMMCQLMCLLDPTLPWCAK